MNLLNAKRRNNDAPLIRLQSVSFSYNAKNTGRALNRVSFFIARGERVAILGHNGSGKSTLAKIMGGLVYPDEGVCEINGKNIQDMPFRELRGTLGIVFQDPENQIVAAMVEDDVAFAPENQRLPSADIQARVELALVEADMTHKKDSPVSALSGGEKQRLALAGALAADVECLILDEPTAMLDPQGRVKIEKVLRYLHAEGMTIAQITHQLEAESFSDIDKIIVLSHGAVKWEGNTGDFWNMAGDLGFDLPDSIRFSRWLDTHGLTFPNSITGIKPPPKNYTPEKITGTEKYIIQQLSFRHDEKNIALNDISAEIYAGEWLSIIGRTGSGKSTLIQHLNALYKIQDGQIFLDGNPLPQKGEGLTELRRKTGLVFQHPEDQLFSPTVKEELAFAPKNAGFKGNELDEAIIYGLECAGLSRDFLERNPIALSGGERRLVAIASVLSARPECVVLDEPLAGLDAHYQRTILKMLGRLRDEGKTIITITHDLNMALKYSNRILILRGGEKITEGTPHEVIHEITESLPVEAWPEALRLSAEIRGVNPDFPLTFDYDELIALCGQGINDSHA